MHVEHVCIPADLGPGFVSWIANVDDVAVCLVTPQARDNSTIRNQVVEHQRRAGIDCGNCTTCPVGLTRAAG